VGDSSATTTMNSDGVGCSSGRKFNVQCSALPWSCRVDDELSAGYRWPHGSANHHEFYPGHLPLRHSLPPSLRRKRAELCPKT